MLGKLHAPSDLESCDFLSQLEVTISGKSTPSIKVKQTHKTPASFPLFLAFSSLGKDFIELPDFGACRFKSQKVADNAVDEARIPAESVDLIERWKTLVPGIRYPLLTPKTQSLESNKVYSLKKNLLPTAQHSLITLKTHSLEPNIFHLHQKPCSPDPSKLHSHTENPQTLLLRVQHVPLTPKTPSLELSILHSH